MINHIKFGMLLLLLPLMFIRCGNSVNEKNWDSKYDFIYEIKPLVFHYDHGVLAGSYPQNKETVGIEFNDVCKYLGHVCLCGAGGFKVSEKALNLLNDKGGPPERGEFILISSNDHTVSDVAAYILGCSRRTDAEKNQYFIDTSLKITKREYHYYIGYPRENKAVHIVYRKHLLVGNEQMDSLWKVELAYEENPGSVSADDIGTYQKAMYGMVQDVLLDRKKGLFEAELIDYNDFLSMLGRLKGGMYK